MIPLARRWVDGVRGVIAEHELPWNVTQLGCRAEYWFRRPARATAPKPRPSIDHELDRYMHLCGAQPRRSC